MHVGGREGGGGRGEGGRGREKQQILPAVDFPQVPLVATEYYIINCQYCYSQSRKILGIIIIIDSNLCTGALH